MTSAVRGYQGGRVQMLPVDRLSWEKPRTTGTRCRSFSFAKPVQAKLKNENEGGDPLKPNYRREVRIVLLMADLAKH